MNMSLNRRQAEDLIRRVDDRLQQERRKLLKLDSCLRVLWNTNSPAAKYMSLLIWMQYRHCAGEFDRVTRYKMTGEAIDKLTRLGGAFYDDGTECLPQGNELELDDSIRGRRTDEIGGCGQRKTLVFRERSCC